MKGSDCLMCFQTVENKLFSKIIGVNTRVAEMRDAITHFFPLEIKNFNRSINKRLQKFFDDLMDEIKDRKEEISAWTVHSIKTATPMIKVQRPFYPDSPASLLSLPVSTFSPAPSVSTSDFLPASTSDLPVVSTFSVSYTYEENPEIEIQTFLELKNLLNERFMDSTLKIKIDGKILRADGGILRICES